MIPKFGWKRDAPDERDHLFSAAPSVPVPEAFSLRQHVKRVLDQGQTSSCVAHAFAQAITICEDMAGLEYDPPSRLYLYACARALTGDQDRDEGTYLRSAAKALQLMGAPTESYWPFKAISVNMMPSTHAHMMAHARRGGTYQRIAGSGETRLRQIRSAIASGYPVTFGTNVSASFCELEGPTRVDAPLPSDPIVGGHAMTIVSYDPFGFEVVNSWSKAFRDRGFVWLSNEYIAAPYSSDFWTVKSWKRIADARARKDASEEMEAVS